jgi:hypothetical protein
MIKTIQKNGKTYADINSLTNWKKNPRSITKDGFDRLKKQITRLGKYKPLLITAGGVVIGGNMRLRALRALDVKTVQVTIIEFHEENGKYYATIDGEREGEALFNSPEDGMMEYSLSDNDRAGFYDDDMLANLMPQYDIDWSEYAIDLHRPVTIDEQIFSDTGLTDEFSLPEGDREGLQQVTFILADEQAELIKEALSEIKNTEDYKNLNKEENENSNGNALFLIVRQWLKNR